MSSAFNPLHEAQNSKAAWMLVPLRLAALAAGQNTLMVSILGIIAATCITIPHTVGVSKEEDPLF